MYPISYKQIITLFSILQFIRKQSTHRTTPTFIFHPKTNTMNAYKIDATHSNITFKVKHLMITNVTGSFTDFDASLTANNADFADAIITFEAAVNSISTNNEQRDEHLKSDDFFAAATHPKLLFQSTAFTAIGNDTYELKGNLTIKGTTQSVALLATYGGTMTDFYGQEKVGFEITGSISRAAFGLTWGAVTEAGGVVVADEIKLLLSVQMVKQPAA